MENCHLTKNVSQQKERDCNLEKKLTGKASLPLLACVVFVSSVIVSCGGGSSSSEPESSALSLKESHSSSIALTSDDTRVVVVNREADTVSVLAVRDDGGEDIESLVVELAVGKEPRYVAISPDDKYAYVSNAEDSTVSVIDLSENPPAVFNDPIKVGVEPRGLVFTPNGSYVFVANHTEGTVSVINTADMQVINTIKTGGNPTGIAISNDGDGDDQDEKVYVTRFFAELIDKARPDGFDDAKQGVIDSFTVEDAINDEKLVAISKTKLLPMADSGFTNDRRQYCLNTRNSLQASGEVTFFLSGPNGTGDGASRLANEVFCPDVNSTDASALGPIANTLQGVYPNLLSAVMVRGNTLYAPNIGVQPEPPVFFENNVQGLVSIYDTAIEQDLSVNLNAQIKQEAILENATGSLVRAFSSDLVAIDANADGSDFLIVSRGGSYVIRANLDDNKQLVINAPDAVTRFQTGSMPTGVVMSSNGTRAYTNNEINRSVTSINLLSNSVITRDIHASSPPLPGTPEHRIEIGKLAFFTALGIPDTLDTDGDKQFDIPIREIIPVNSRGKASNSGWSSCASCHEDGRSDNVTWIFPTGAVQTVPMEGTFAKNDITDQRILNWSAVRGSITDFNNNARGVQGGVGFATNVNGTNRTGEVFNHGLTSEVSDALDAMTEWTATIRALNMPQLKETAVIQQASGIFVANCASCHGGVKWTKSSTSPYLSNPTFTENPIGAGFFTAGPAPAMVPTLDTRLTVAGSSIVKIDDVNAGTLTFLDNVGTFNPNNVLEIRGAGAIAGQSTQGFPALGGGGFNSPSLLGVGYHSPYLHDGSAEDLSSVFQVHTLPSQNGVTIASVLTEEEQQVLIQFLNTIDDTTPVFESDTDKFLQTVNGLK